MLDFDMIVLHTAIAFCMAHPVECIAVLTFLQATIHTIAVEQKWRWAVVTSKILAALPAVSIAGLASAAKKPEDTVK